MMLLHCLLLLGKDLSHSHLKFLFFAIVSLDLTKQSFGGVGGFCQLC